jgi:hypothetical protein
MKRLERIVGEKEGGREGRRLISTRLGMQEQAEAMRLTIGNNSPINDTIKLLLEQVDETNIKGYFIFFPPSSSSSSSRFPLPTLSLRACLPPPLCPSPDSPPFSPSL